MASLGISRRQTWPRHVSAVKRRDESGYANAFYDPYPKESQAIFWKQVSTKINSKGFDAYWLDASEPDIHSNLNFTKRKELMSREGGVGSGAEYFNS